MSNRSHQETLTNSKPVKRVLLGVAAGGFAIQAENLIRNCPPNVQLFVIAPVEIRERLENCSNGRHLHFVDLQGFRKQHRADGIMLNCTAFLSSILRSLMLIRKHRPDIVISVGQRISAYLMAAARIMRVPGYYVECVTRVTKGSSTGNFIARLRLAKRIYVQWPEAKGLYRNAIYRGRLL